MKKALVTGALGQDGSYMCEYLLSKGYEVWGTVRRSFAVSENLNTTLDQNYVLGVTYRYADMSDTLSLETLIRSCHPDEVYNFAGQVFVPTSWTSPEATFNINTSGLARILKLVSTMCPRAKVYQASSSEMFGNIIMKPRSAGITTSSYTVLNETSPMHPVSPYGVSKLAAHKLVDVYRQAGLYVVSGIVFNHESPRRGSEMVTRKITKHIAAVKSGKDVPKLRLGSPDSKRDWGYAGDYVKAMHKMLQHPTPDDYVIGTGEAHSVKEFVDRAMESAGVSCDVKYNCVEFTRANELHCLIADYGKMIERFGWHPETSFGKLVDMMVDADYKRYQNMKSEEAVSV